VKSWCLATWAVLLELHAIWIVAAVLLGDVITFFAVNARHSDFWADIRALAGHGDSLFLYLLLMNRGVRIPSLRGCGKKEGFSRIQRRKRHPRRASYFRNSVRGSTRNAKWDRPGASTNLLIPSGAHSPLYTENYLKSFLVIPTEKIYPQAVNDFSSSPGVLIHNLTWAKRFSP